MILTEVWTTRDILNHINMGHFKLRRFMRSYA